MEIMEDKIIRFFYLNRVCFVSSSFFRDDGSVSGEWEVNSRGFLGTHFVFYIAAYLG